MGAASALSCNAGIRFVSFRLLQGEHKKKTGIVTVSLPHGCLFFMPIQPRNDFPVVSSAEAIHGHCPRHKHPLNKIKEDDDPFEDEKPKEEARGSPHSDGMGCLELLYPRSARTRSKRRRKVWPRTVRLCPKNFLNPKFCPPPFALLRL